MAKRSSKRKPRMKAATSQRNWSLWVAGIVCVAVIVVAIRLIMPQAHSNADLRAALIDQLSPAFPNDEFRSSIMADFAILDLPVDVYEGEEIDVDFYRALGEKPYGMLVIRSHSGTLQLGGSPDQRTIALFTNEPYSGSRHIAEQIVDRVLIVRPFEDDPELTFGVTPDFFLKSMRGDLPRTVVVVAGCSILGDTDLAEALISRGASVVISWNLTVGLEHADAGTRLLVHHLLTEGMTVEEAVSSAMDEFGPDPEFGAILKYHPASAGPYTVEQLLGR